MNDEGYICLSNKNREFKTIGKYIKASLLGESYNPHRKGCKCNVLIKGSDNFGIKEEIFNTLPIDYANCQIKKAADLVLFEIHKVLDYAQSDFG